MHVRRRSCGLNRSALPRPPDEHLQHSLRRHPPRRHPSRLIDRSEEGPVSSLRTASNASRACWVPFVAYAFRSFRPFAARMVRAVVVRVIKGGYLAPAESGAVEDGHDRGVSGALGRLSPWHTRKSPRSSRHA